jgi:hypothetical protein
VPDLTCPRCAAPYTENFRWCRKCGLDFHKPPKVIAPDAGVRYTSPSSHVDPQAVQEPRGEAPPLRIASTHEWRVKYDGRCADCGTALHKGTVATWDRLHRRLRCLSCASGAKHQLDGVLDPGTPGGSARAKYEQLRKRHEIDVKGKYGSRLGGWVMRFTDDPQSIRAWALGAAGEIALAAAFADVPDLWMLHDRRVAGTKGNIDHILVTPSGVFVIDAKNYSGLVEVRNVGSWFRPANALFVGGRDRSGLADGLAWQVSAVRGALAHADLPSMPPISGVLCFVGSRWPRFGRASEFQGVRLDSPDTLKSVLRDAPVLRAGTVEEIVHTLAKALPPR